MTICIRRYYGSEFISKAMDEWAHRNGVKLDFSRPGKPTDNAFIESFNGRLRQECLNQNWFTSLDDARRIVETWREDYNEIRPLSLGIVVYEMVTNQVPFTGETASDIIVSLLQNEPPALREHSPETPAELQKIISRMLVKEREQRYQTARDILADLKHLKQRIDSGITKAPVAEESEAGVAAAHTKRCPVCQRVYTDVTLNFCLDDMARLTIEHRASLWHVGSKSEPLKKRKF